MGEEDYYLELCERPVHFEKANPVNCVFFDEANKQVRAGPRPTPPRGPARPARRRRCPQVSRALGPGARGPGLGPLLPCGRGIRASPFLWDQAPPRPGLSPPRSDSGADPSPRADPAPLGRCDQLVALRCFLGSFCCLYLSLVSLAFKDLDVEIFIILGIL